jgi:hypothetical protein
MKERREETKRFEQIQGCGGHGIKKCYGRFPPKRADSFGPVCGLRARGEVPVPVGWVRCTSGGLMI